MSTKRVEMSRPARANIGRRLGRGLRLDWRLLPSISIIESSGGKDYRNNNVFGWDSCRESFTSVREGIHFVAGQLANSKLYKDKTLDSKLSTYNPLPDYPRKVKAVMHALGSESLPRISSLN